MRDSRYDILFEPVQIGPVTAPNRFYQVPHCNGLGHLYPRAEAAQRGIKAEGGWGVVSTQEVEIHPSSEWTPFVEGRLWDEGDMKRLRLTTEAVHAHGALAAIEITHNGHASANAYSRMPAMGVTAMLFDGFEPAQAYAMTKRDIANVRKWHRRAALRAREIGFDIIYVYAAHDLALPFHFLSRRNTRTDEYGGSLQNRARFLRELLEDTRDAVGGTCAVALRFAVDECKGEHGIRAQVEGREVVEMLAELPDLWDVNISDWSNDSATARFAEEGWQLPYVSFVKKVTAKPVVGVGRFTSPDAMLAHIKNGVLDFIGAARPSIADPFLPEKIKQGRPQDIRECIGCNICVSGDMTSRPIRCTQNPTIGEEYRRNWHPEKIPPARAAGGVFIVGGGVAGLEAALSLARRGVRVLLAEAESEFGGRAVRESKLPGLATWRRVAEYRLGQLQNMRTVEMFAHSKLSAEQAVEFAAESNCAHIVAACGSLWTRDAAGRAQLQPPPADESIAIVTPDDIMRGEMPPRGAVLIYDDDHYYMGGVLAELLAAAGNEVTLVTPAAEVSAWTRNTLEQTHIERRLRERKVRIIERHRLARIANARIELQHVNGGGAQCVEAQSAVMVTARRARDEIFFAMEKRAAESGIAVARIGDCLAPGTIAAAVYAGHVYAREFGESADAGAVPFRREYTGIGARD